MTYKTPKAVRLYFQVVDREGQGKQRLINNVVDYNYIETKGITLLQLFDKAGKEYLVNMNNVSLLELEEMK
jgi:hypothetical protein